LTATAALMLLPALTLAGCRAGEQTSRAAASPAPIQEANRPPEGTNWTTDAPPPVTGAAGVAAPDDGSSARERALADREAAVAQREADVARREQTASVAPRIAAPRHTTTTTRHTTSRRTTAPAPAPSRTEIASRHEEPAPAPAPVERREPERVTVPAGTNLAAEVTNGASSATAQVGDGVSARVAQDVYAGGQLAIPAGSRLSGTVTDVQGLRRVGGQARLAVRFDSVELPNGTRAPIYASWSSTGRNETRRDAATIGGGAAGGAVLGRVLGGSRHRDEHTAKGAVVGAVLGTVIAARNQRGAQVELPEGSTVDLTLADSVRVTVGR
jgi:hypothetical protein